MLVVGMAPGVTAFGVPDGGTTTDLTDTSDSLATVEVCDQELTVSAGPDFETTKDKSVQFVADLDPDDADVTVVSYEWRDSKGPGTPGKGKGKGKDKGKGNDKGNGNGGGQGSSDQVLSTDQSFETTLDPGEHTITLTVELADGRTLTDTVTVTIRGNGKGNKADIPPIADAGDCQMAIAGEDTQLNGAESYDRDGTIESYEWDLDGDGTTDATGETPTVQFEDLGNQTVELTVTDDGNTDTDTVTLFVNDRPDAAFEHAPTRPNPNESVTFDAGTSSDTLDGVETYVWDFDGDGTTEATGETATHAFATPGNYTVTLAVTDTYGVSNTTTTTVHVNHPPEADASNSDQRANVTESLTLDGTSSTDVENAIESYEWDIDGDGEFEKTGATVAHAFEIAGNETVTLRVTDDGGLTDTDTITVEVNAPPEADASNSEQQVNVSESFELNGTASSDDRGIASYEWDVDGDGEFEKTGTTVTHSYGNSDDKNVTLRVTDTWGVTDTDTVTIEVNDPPTAVIDSSNETVEIGESVAFDGTKSTDTDGEIVGYEWDFDGDGTTDVTGPTSDHAYSADGSYTVRLTVTDDDGATDTTTQTITVLPDEIDGEPPGVPSPPDDPIGGGVTGDPHFSTFHGGGYDFQAVGEYVLAREPNGSLSVQGRLTPVSERPVSVVEAVSTSVNGHDVTVDAADETPLVVDGTRHELGSPEQLAVGNGTIFRRGSTYTVVYPGEDGEVDAGDERLTIRVRGDRLGVWLTLQSDREHAVEGLLGTPDKAAPDVALADGTPVSPSDYDALYGEFRDDWRVDSLAQSHFHYEDGESPDYFYDPDYPSALLTVEDLSDAERSAAEQAAEAAGLEPGTPAFENAVLDYALTGDDSYLESAATSQPVNASFTVDAGQSFTANASDSVTFVSTIQNAAAADVDVEWRFGDGAMATGTEVSHTYDATGTYTVTVTATGPDGGVTRDTLAVTVAENATTDQPPVPDVTVTQPNETHARLDASESVDPDGTITGYAWDTDGDGEVESHNSAVTVLRGQTATEVSLVVLDDDGNRSATMVQVGPTTPATVSAEWNATFDGGERDRAQDVAVDGDGNAYVVGYEDNGANFDWRVAKYDSSGTLQWSRTHDGGHYAIARGVAVDSDGNVYIAGKTYDDGTYDWRVVKYDSSGTQQWVTTYDNSYDDHDIARGVAVDDDGTVYVVGTGTNGANKDWRVAKYDSSGTLQWVITYDGGGYDYLSDVALDDAGNVYVTGKTEEDDGTAIRTAKYDSSGTQQWATTYGDDGESHLARSIAVDEDGNVYLTGYTYSSPFTWMTLKYNSNGSKLWDVSYDNTSYTRGQDVAVDDAGNPYVAGYTRTESYERRVMKYDASGNRQWNKTYDSGGDDFAFGIALDSTGNVYVTGGSRTSRSNEDWRTTKYSRSRLEPPNEPPLANATASASSVETGETVTFDASESSDPDGDSLTYEWDFDSDGSVDVTSETVNHSYSESGTYDATVTVTDNDGATATATVTVNVESTNLSEGLIHHWKLDGDATDNAGDAAGDIRGATFTNGQDGQAAVFDGDSWIESEPTGIPSTTTISFWAKPNDTPSGSFVAQGGPDRDNPFIFWALHYSLRLDSDQHTLDEMESKWQRITAVIEDNGDGSSDVTYYQNESILWQDTLSDTILSQSRPVTIGAEYDNTGITDHFEGLIDDVRVYNHTLSHEEVADLYKATKSPTASISVNATEVAPGETVTFDASESSDSD